MIKNTLTQIWGRFTQFIDYTPPTTPDYFVLDEARPYDSAQTVKHDNIVDKLDLSHHAAMLEFAQRLSKYIEKVLRAIELGSLVSQIDAYKAELLALENQWHQLSPLTYAYEHGQNPADARIDTSLEKNRKAIESIYRLPRNKDVVIRDIALGERQRAAGLIIYIEGIVDSQKLNRFVLEPLMGTNSPLYGKDTLDQLIKTVIPSGQMQRVVNLKSLQESINTGDTALIVDGIGEAIIIETKGW